MLRARLVLVALLALPLLLAGPAAPAPADTHDQRLRLDVTSLGPPVLRPDGTVTARATVRNDGPVTLQGLEVRLFAWTPRLTSRDAVRDWAEGSSGVRAGNRLVALTEVDALAPGARARVDLQAPAAAMGLPAQPSAWGPRGLTVDVVAPPDYTQLAVARGFTVWDPRAEPGDDEAVPVSLLVPLTAGPPDVASGLVGPREMAELTAGGGRLARVVEASAATQAAWAVDPAVLAAADAASRAAGDGAARDPEAPVRWLDAVRQQAGRRGLLALPRCDPDLVGLAQAGTGELYTLAARQGRADVARLLGVAPLAEAAWPVGGSAGGAALDLAAESGATAVVLSAAAQPPVDGEDDLVSGRSTVPAGGDRLDGLLVDTTLSGLLTDATQGEDAALATSRLVAETAAVARSAAAAEQDPPHLLLSLPRDWDPDVRAATSAVQALTEPSWVREAPLQELLEAEPDEVDRAAVTEPAGPGQAPPRLDAEGLRAVAATLAGTREMASALSRPDELLDAAEISAVAATSVSWLEVPARWRSAVDALGDATAEVRTAVHVVEGSAVTVVSAEADLPVTVANELEQDVRVVLSAQPRSPRLVAQGDVAVRLAEGSTERVALPVRAVANGNTDVLVTVRAPDGALLGDPVTVPVRVRADWETRGILVAGAALVVVLVVGLTRTIRRGRRRGAVEETGAGR